MLSLLRLEFHNSQILCVKLFKVRLCDPCVLSVTFFTFPILVTLSQMQTAPSQSHASFSVWQAETSQSHSTLSARKGGASQSEATLSDEEAEPSRIGASFSKEEANHFQGQGIQKI